jgi:hypothetical protein
MDRPQVIGGGDLRMFDLSYLHRRHHHLGHHQVRNLSLQLALLDHHVPLHRQHCCRQPMMVLMILRMPSSTQDLLAVMPQLLVTKTVMRLVTKTVMPLMYQLLVTKTVRHVKTLMYQLLDGSPIEAVASSHVWETVRHVEGLPLEAGHPACHVLDHCRHPAL